MCGRGCAAAPLTACDHQRAAGQCEASKVLSYIMEHPLFYLALPEAPGLRWAEGHAGRRDTPGERAPCRRAQTTQTWHCRASPPPPWCRPGPRPRAPTPAPAWAAPAAPPELRDQSVPWRTAPPRRSAPSHPDRPQAHSGLALLYVHRHTGVHLHKGLKLRSSDTRS